MVERSIDWSRKDLPKEPNLHLREEVFERIRKCLHGEGLIEKSKRLELQNIFIPTIDCERITEESEWRDVFVKKSIVFIEDPMRQIAYSDRAISTEDESGINKSDWIRLHFKDLFPPDRRMSDVVLEYQGGNFPRIFQRQGVMKGDVYMGEYIDSDEFVMLVVDEQDGVPKTFSLLLPKDWRNTAGKSGRLIEGSREEQNRSKPMLSHIDPDSLSARQDRGDQPKMTISEKQMRAPESELRYEAIRRISEHLREKGLQYELNPQDISIPAISMGRGLDEFRTQRVLERIGLPKGFSAIFVREKDGQEEETISVSGWQPNENMYCLDLTTANGSMISPAFIFKNMTNPSVFEVGHSNKEIRLGNISPTEERVLLIRGHYGGRWEVSSLALPQGWRSVFDEGGRLKEPELIRRAKTEIEQLFRQTQGVTGMTQNTILEEKKPTEQLPQLTFAQILAKVKTFPFYRGPAEGKEGIRTAIFGKAKTPAEIKVLDNDILKNGARVSFKFCAFNGNKLEDVFKRNRRVHDRLTLEAFASCFIPGFESKDNLVLKLSLDTTGQTKLEGNLVRWDIGKGGEVDSFPYLRSNLESHELDEIRKIMNDKNITLSFFFSQLETAEDQAKKTSVGEMIEEMRFLRRTAGRDSWETDFGMSGGYTGGDDFYRERRSGNGVKNIEGLLRDETPFPENARSQYIGKPAPSFKDRDPEKRKEESRKYWAHKAERRNRKSKNLGKSKKRK